MSGQNLNDQRSPNFVKAIEKSAALSVSSQNSYTRNSQFQDTIEADTFQEKDQGK